MIVLVIVGVLASGAVSTLSYLDEVRSDAATSMAAGHLRYSRFVAMSTHLRTWVVFDVSNEGYAAYVEDPNNLGKVNRLALTDPLTRASLSVDLSDGMLSGVDLSTANINGSAEIEFDSWGVPYDTSSAALTSDATLTFADGTTITVTAETGYVSIN